MSKIKIIQLSLKKLYDILKKNNNSEENILSFLAMFFFFIFLEKTDYLKEFNKEIEKIKGLQSPEEFQDLIDSINNYIAELFHLNHLKKPIFSKNFLQELKNSELLNLNLSDIKAFDFCNIFESLINEKHSNGMYFTSQKNIKKAIKPLFLEELENELDELIVIRDQSKLFSFLIKLTSLKFLDPACGAGHFLIITYKKLKNLEQKSRITLDSEPDSNLTVKTSQFYGIELNPAVTLIAQIALKIAELEESNTVDLSSSQNIVTANALRFDWNDLVKNIDLDYIIGNPPFLGARVMDKSQKEDLKTVFGSHWKLLGDLDYVSGWFKKAYDYMKGTFIKASLVATSSISEGLSAGILFGPLIQDGFNINFAYQTFQWEQDNNNAVVYVVIIGFSAHDFKDKALLFSGDKRYEVDHINGYLMAGPEIYLTRHLKPLSDVPEMGIGCKPIDGGNFLFKEEEYKEFLKEEPKSKKFFVPFYGAKELVNQKPRYCLYLGESNPEEYQDLILVQDRVNKVKEFRLRSKSSVTRKLAKTPTKFHVTNFPHSNYLAIPRVSSQNREYIPIGFMDIGTMASDALLIIPNTTLYHFGVLTSKLHMIWLNFVCGRLGNAIRYSKHLVYNNFPWPEPTLTEKETIESSAEKILKIREKYGNNLEKLYNPKTMPDDLKEAHLENDKAVLKAYHFEEQNEEELLNRLFERYIELEKKG